MRKNKCGIQRKEVFFYLKNFELNSAYSFWFIKMEL